MKKLNKSDVILCPDCSEEIAELAHDLNVGDALTITAFDFKPGHEIHDGTPRCNKCGAMWILSGVKLKIKNKGIVP